MDTTLTPAAPTAAPVTDRERLVGRLAWASAWSALVLGQLHALARHATEDGRQDLDLPLTRLWAEPAADLLSPLLTWADPDVVYLTYGKVWLPVFVAFTLAAFVAYRRRQPRRFEKWAWRVALGGYVAACVAVAAEYWTQWTAINEALLTAVFVATIPAMLVTMLGSTVLGVTLLVKRHRPTLPAVLLALALPGVFAISMVTSLGNVVLPVAFAFGILGRRWSRA